MFSHETPSEDYEPDQEGTENKPEFESITGPQSETEYIRQILRQEIQENPEALQTGIEMENLEKKYGTYQDYVKRHVEDASNIKKAQEELIAVFAANEPETQNSERMAEGNRLLRQQNLFLENKSSIESTYANAKAIMEEIQDLKTKRDAFEYNTPGWIEKHKLVNEKYIEFNEKKQLDPEKMKQLSAYQTSMADFIKKNSDDESFLEQFWQAYAQLSVAEDMAKSGLSENINRVYAQRTRAAVLSQVAIMHALEQNGHTYRMATPDEDAFDKIDLWTGTGETALQIKGTPDLLAVKKVGEDESLSFPATQVTDNEGNVIHLSDVVTDEERMVRQKISDYKARNGIKNLTAFIVAIPHNKMKKTNAMPDDDVIKLIGEKIGHGPNYKEKPAQ